MGSSANRHGHTLQKVHEKMDEMRAEMREGFLALNRRFDEDGAILCSLETRLEEFGAEREQGAPRLTDAYLVNAEIERARNSVVAGNGRTGTAVVEDENSDEVQEVPTALPDVEGPDVEDGGISEEPSMDNAVLEVLSSSDVLDFLKDPEAESNVEIEEDDDACAILQWSSSGKSGKSKESSKGNRALQNEEVELDGETLCSSPPRSTQLDPSPSAANANNQDEKDDVARLDSPMIVDTAEELELTAVLDDVEVALGAIESSTDKADGEQSKLSKEDASKLVKEADKLRSQLFSLSNPTNPKEVYGMYKKAADDAANVEAIMQLARLNLEGCISLHPSGGVISVSMENVGVLLETLKRLPMDDEQKVEMLILQGDVALKQRKHTRSLKFYEAAAKGGHAKALYKVGKSHYDMHYEAVEEEEKIEHLDKALECLSQAAEKRSGEAAVILSVLYANEEGHELWNAAIDKYESARMAHGGKELRKVRKKPRMARLGTKARTMRAKEYCVKSVEWGCAQGYNDRATCYEDGFADIEPDFDKAVADYTRAFELGYTTAANNLGMLYDPDGFSAQPQHAADAGRADAQKAMYWYGMGKKAKDADATLSLAEAYEEGKMVARNAELALKHYGEAAQYAEGSDKDKAAAARGERRKMLVTAALVDGGAQHWAEIETAADTRALLAKVKVETHTMVSGKMKPALHPLRMADARNRLVELVGEPNASAMVGRIEALIAGADAAGNAGLTCRQQLAVFLKAGKAVDEL